jgi:hypothetical protein
VSVDTATRTPAPPIAVAAQYEALRSAALGGPLPPEARHGLLLFLRRGMWAWTQAVATAAADPPPPARVTASVFASPQERSGVIHVFAAMALSSPSRRVR